MNDKEKHAMNGYKEMGEINLSLAEIDYSQLKNIINIQSEIINVLVKSESLLSLNDRLILSKLKSELSDIDLKNKLDKFCQIVDY
jgi:hypothetical protein